jgi:hypothetical protein
MTPTGRKAPFVNPASQFLKRVLPVGLPLISSGCGTVPPLLNNTIQMKKLLPFGAALILFSCSESKSDLCAAGSLNIGRLTGEWKVVTSASGQGIGYTYMFDQGHLKVITSANDYSTQYETEVVGSTLYTTVEGSDEYPNSYCVEYTDTSLVLTQVLSGEEKKELALQGNTTFGHEVLTLKKTGN